MSVWLFFCCVGAAAETRVGEVSTSGGKLFGGSWVCECVDAYTQQSEYELEFNVCVCLHSRCVCVGVCLCVWVPAPTNIHQNTDELEYLVCRACMRVNFADKWE